VTNWQESWSKAKTETVQACLAKMLETNVFAHAERQKRLLAYLISQTLAGRSDRLKGYTIAIDVFDRNSDFDPAVEPIVRVETARLRAKLREYYADEGRLDPVRIEIPKGAYSVRICDTADARPREADAAGKEEKPSLAVLPFANMSDDPGQDYFVDGIVEDLTTDLSKLSGLVVISRHSAFAYKGTGRSAGAAAHAWLTRSYVFRRAMNWIGEDSFEVAYEHAKIAVALDDNLPLGHAVLGWVQMWRKQPNEALSAGRHAVALDPNNADAQLFLSITLSALGRGKESLNYIRSAIRLNPHPSTLYLMALGVSYYVLGQFEEAIGAFQRGVELWPLFPPNQAYLAITYLRLDRKDEALAAWRSHLTLTNAGPCAAFWIEEKLRTAHTNALERLDELIRR
jgi:tetratricopeptide (TPR) repeat protein